MNKTIAGISLGVLLIAGQAWASASQPVSARIADRVGAELGHSSNWGLDSRAALPPLPVAIIGSAVIIAAVYAAIEDSSDSA